MTPPDADSSRWFADQVHPHGPQLKTYLHASFPTLADVDDVVQESYLRIWKARAIQPIDSAKAFLFRIARHLAVDLVRRHGRSPIRTVPDLSTLAVPDEHRGAADRAVLRDEIELLARALESLPPRCREIIVLRKFQNLPQKVVAERLGIAESTVQEQVYRGLRRCEKFLRAQGVLRPWYDE